MISVANEVSSMETELISLRSEIDILKKHQGVIEFENDQLRKSLAKSQTERDNYMRRAEAIKTLLDQTGSSLVHGIEEYHRSERKLVEETTSSDAPPPRMLSTAERAFG